MNPQNGVRGAGVPRHNGPWKPHSPPVMGHLQTLMFSQRTLGAQLQPPELIHSLSRPGTLMAGKGSIMVWEDFFKSPREKEIQGEVIQQNVKHRKLKYLQNQTSESSVQSHSHTTYCQESGLVTPPTPMIVLKVGPARARTPDAPAFRLWLRACPPALSLP